MSRQTGIPTRESVLATLEQLRNEAGRTGREPSSLSLARRLGLANTTFRRHFPEIAGRLTTARTPGTPDRSDTGTADGLRQDVLRLRHDNRNLRDHLELAIANIQRLTIENDQLRRQAEAVSQIRHLPPRR